MVDISTYRFRIGTFMPRLRKFRSDSLEINIKCGKIYLGLSLLILSASVCINEILLGRVLIIESVLQPLNGNVNFIEYYVQLLRPVSNNFYARYTFGNKKHGMKLVHWNKGSSFLENKLDEIQALIQQHKPHVLGLSEANLFKHHDMSKVKIPDYELHHCISLNDPDLQVSRVVVYTHCSLVVKVRDDLMDKKFSAIWLEVGLPNKRKILVCNAYREWGYLNQGDKSSHSKSAQLDRWKVFIDMWERALKEGKEVLVLGDMNINSLKWMNADLPQKAFVELLFDKIIPFGVSQQVTVPTHNESCLDHIYTNNIVKLSNVTAQRNGGSDHKVIHVIRHAESIGKSTRYTTKRCFKNFNAEGFKLAVKAVNWFEVYMAEDVNLAADLFTRKLTEVLDLFAPVRTIQLRKTYAPWLQENTKIAMEERNLAQQAAISSKDIDRFRVYKNIRNKVNNMIKSDKRSWEKLKLDHMANNSGNLWRNIKEIMNWQTNGPPTQLFYEGRMIRKPLELAKCMNNFFANKVKTLQDRLPPETEDPLHYARKYMSSNKSQLRLKTVFPEQVMEILKNLKNSKSTGLDHIDVGIVKLIADDILPSLTHIINLSLNTSTFPDAWKVAKVVPLLKRGDPLNPQNYRPVALLPILSKILEKVIFTQVVNYVETNDILHPSHHGSRPGHSTCTAILELCSSWIDAIECGNMAAVMMLDLSAAFDLVNHKLLLEKLKLMGFGASTVKWFKSYLADRSQCVCIDGKLSELVEVPVGVPQGSVLGALLYMLFVNELPSVIHDYSDLDGNLDQLAEHNDLDNNLEHELLCCYVDDSTVTVSSSDPLELTMRLSSLYKRLSGYFGNNRLVINDDKTHLLVIATRKYAKLRDLVTISTGTVTIKPTDSEKLLGLHIHQSLKWKEHLVAGKGSLLNSLISRLNGLKRVSINASFRTRLTIANACFMSVLVYMMVVWGGAEGYVIKMIQGIQNKAARVVTKKSWYTPTRILLKECNWLSVKQLIFLHTAVQIWKIIMNRSPKNIYSKLRMANTRSGQNGNLAIPAFQTALGRNSFMVKALLIWNRVPMDIRMTTSLHSFKGKLKAWIRTNIDIE